MNPSRLVVNVPLRLRRVMLHLTLDFYIIIAWSMLATNVFHVTTVEPQCLRVCTWSMHHDWDMPWKSRSWTMLSLVFHHANHGKTSATLLWWISHGKSWTCSHFVLPHDIHNAVDLYVSLEYKHHKDVAISVKLWVDANPKNIFSF
jgi:hypothetical protein